MVGQSILGPHIDSYDIRSSLGLSSKSILHKLDRQGKYPANSIPGYEANYTKVAKLSEKLRYGGYIGIALDVGQSGARIQRACTLDLVEEQCGRTSFRETGRVAGSVGGGAAGGFMAAYATCNLLFGLETAGTSLLWCGIVAGGVGGYLGSNAASGRFEKFGMVCMKKSSAYKTEPRIALASKVYLAVSVFIVLLGLLVLSFVIFDRQPLSP